MLGAGGCVVIDTREKELRTRSFPGAEGGVSFLTLRMVPHQARKELARLRASRSVATPLGRLNEATKLSY